MTNTLGQSPCGDNCYPVEGKGRLHLSFPAKRPSQVLRLVKVLLTKYLLNEEDGLNSREVLTLSEALFLFERQDKAFTWKNKDLLEDLQFVLGGVSPEGLEQLCFARGSYPSWFLAAKSRSGYEGQKKELLTERNLARVIRKWKVSPPKPYIGRGYTDKGNCREVSKDGSPSWQEVASDRKLEKAFRLQVLELLIQEASRRSLQEIGIEEQGFKLYSEIYPEEAVIDILLKAQPVA